MASFSPPVLLFSGSQGNLTERNILASGCFGVNFLDSTNIARAFASVQWAGAERVAKSGFRLSAATRIKAPVVADCRAHLECELRSTQEIGSGYVIFGEIVAAAVWDEVLKAAEPDRYALLDLVVYLEEKLVARVDRVQKVENWER